VCVCVCVVHVKFCRKRGKNFTETFQLFNQTYREDCMSRTQCYEWFKNFKEGRISVSEDPRPGQPSTATNNDHVETVHAVIHGNYCLNVREVADEVSISKGSCHQIFTENFRCVISVQNSCCICCLMIRKRTVLEPVRNCLPMQMVMKTFLRTS